MTDFVSLKVHVFSYIRKMPVHNSCTFSVVIDYFILPISKMLFEFKHLFEKNGLTDLQKVSLSDTFLTFTLLKYFSLV